MAYLIAIDSDKTLRNNDGKITYKTKKVIKDLTSKGHNIVICTSNLRKNALELSKELGLNNYVIASNGAEIYDIKNDKIIHGAFLSKKACKKVYEKSLKKNQRLIFEIDNKEYVTQYKTNDEQILIDEKNIKEILKNKISQITIIGEDNKKMEKYKKKLYKKYKVKITESNEEISFGIINEKTSKGDALKKLAKLLDIPMKNTIAIGNNKNDITMLCIAETSVSLENATDEIKSISDYVTLSNDCDGVADFLKKLL